jgi:SAM-dependent methyltransferase
MISVLSEGSADEVMPETMLTTTLDRVRKHPWWHARADLAIEVLRRNGVLPPATVIDVGCGWGVTLEAMETAGFTVIGLDISRQILEKIDRPKRQLIQADLRQPVSNLAGQADALLLLDVIEHVDDDQQVLHHSAALLRPGGIAVISVPARPDLFSEFDEIQGHRRRYLPDRLGEAFSNTGLVVESIFWWGQWMVPLLSRRNKKRQGDAAGGAKTYADHLKLPPWPIPEIMRLVYAWEQPRALERKLHTGTSLFAIARRNKL